MCIRDSCGGGCTLRGGLTGLPRGLGVPLLDTLFLPHPGNGIAGRLRNLRIIPQRLLIEILGVGRTQFPFCLFHGLVGLHLVVPDAAADGFGGLRSEEHTSELQSQR